jgi:PTH1 family peptidyl-tRNA hydrolase
MWLIAGLGNPGPAHRGQRHNIGFMALDRIASRYLPMGNWRGRFQGETMELTIDGQKCFAIKPQTFMNVSGTAIGDAVNFYKIPLSNVVVLHDDLDLDPGKIDVKQGGGHGGHNGLKSIDAHIGKDYWRVRLGIGHPVKLLGLGPVPKEQKDDLVTHHVLSNFAKDELAWADPLLDRVAAAIPLLLAGDVQEFRTALTSCNL